MAVTLDTQKFVDALEKAQVPREQARAVVATVRASHDAVDVASKQDLRNLESNTQSKFDLLRKDIANVEQRLDAKIDLVRSDLRGDINLLRWMMGITLAGVGTTVAKLFWT